MSDPAGVEVSLIAAVAENGVIGRDGGLPWRLPEDLKRFKRMTIGHTVLMGRRTFDERGVPLPDRRNVIVTRDASWARDGVWVARSVEQGFELALRLEAEAGGDTLYVVGGETIYRALLDRADRIDLTVVHASVEGDTRFPELDEAAWRVEWEEHHDRDERHEHAFTFRVLRPVGRGGA